MKSFTLTIIFYFIFTSLTYSQYPNWENYSDGSYVNTIIKENDNLWIGTKGGLVKYNYQNQQTFFYNKCNSGLPTNEIRCGAIDNNGIKWLYTLGVGLVRYNDTTMDVITTTSPGVYIGVINDISIDNQNNIWIATYGKGLLKFNGIDWIIFNSSNSSLPTDYLNNVFIDNSGNKWISTGGAGLIKYNDTTWTNYQPNNNAHFNNVCQDESGKIWVVSLFSGFYSYDGTNWTQYHTGNSTLPSNNVNYITVDNLNNIWIGTDLGATKLSNSVMNHYLNGKYVKNIKFDINNNVYCGTSGNGLFYFNNSSWTQINTSNSGIIANDVYSVGIDNNNNKYFSAYTKGIVKFDGTNWTNYPTINGLTKSIKKDLAGNMWFGTMDKGLIKYNGTSWTTYNISNSGLPSNSVYSIDFDSINNVWIGTQSGLAYYNGSVWTLYNTSNSNIPNNFINSVCVDNSNKLWIATSNGIAKFENNTFTIYNEINSDLPVNSVNTISCDYSGTLWIGTQGGGIASFNGTIWNIYNSSNVPILTNNIKKIICNNNTKWISNDNKLIKFNGIDWTEFNSLNSGLSNTIIQDIAIDNNGYKWIVDGNTGNGNGANVLKTREDSLGYFTIKGKVFFDENNNGIKETSENYISNQKMVLANINKYAFTNNLGEYTFYVESGNYTIQYNPISPWESTTLDSFQIILNSISENIQDIGVYASPFSNIILSSSTNPWECDMTTHCYINYKNTGTQNENGSIHLILDTSIQYLNSTPSYISLLSNEYIWNFNNLLPNEERQIDIEILMPNFESMGDTLTIISSLISPNFSLRDTLKEEILCSYDPNDKSVNPIGFTNQKITAFNTDLNYTIRFQNTGNAPAKNIIIKDTISNFMNIYSFVLLSSSHSVDINIEGKIITFYFRNIFLPDSSSNELESHGFVKFRISPESNLSENTQIKNKAFIFFDFNPPIITNEVLNTYSSFITSSQVFAINSLMSVYPNPATDEVFIESPKFQVSNSKFKGKNEYKVYSIDGKKVLEGKLETSKTRISTKDLESGVYFIEVESSKGKVQSKLVITK